MQRRGGVWGEVGRLSGTRGGRGIVTESQPWGVLRVVRAARSSEGRGRACQRWGGQAGSLSSVPALEGPWRRALIRQMVLGPDVCGVGEPGLPLGSGLGADPPRLVLDID